MSDQSSDESAALPGWTHREPEGPSESWPREEQPKPSSPSSPDLHTAEPSQSSTTRSSSPGSGSEPPKDPSAAPVPLKDLVAEALQMLSAGASILTRRKFGFAVKMTAGEARTLAAPIARIAARRFQIKRDLSDATDVVGTGGGIFSWVDRILASRVQAQPQPVYAEELRYFEQPRPEQQPAFIQQQEQPAPTPAGRPTVADQNGQPVVGTGPAKGAYLAGFEDM